jgi:hypothetical protein
MKAGIVSSFAVLALSAVGCNREYQLHEPVVLQSPFPGEQTWAVAPFANESGVSSVDVLGISDHFVTELNEVSGIRAIPLNRTLTAMRALEMKSVQSDEDARALLDLLQVDGLIVGSVTTYEPYRPLQLGIAAQSYTVTTRAPRASNAEELFLSTGDRGPNGALLARSSGVLSPTSQVSSVIDMRNHDTLRRLDQYAKARAAPKSGFRDQIYGASIDALGRFAAYATIEDLLARERTRLADQAAAAAVVQGRND